MDIKDPEELRVPGNNKITEFCNSFQESLPCKFFHLDIIKFTEIAEPLDELGGDTASKLLKRAVNMALYVNFCFLWTLCCIIYVYVLPLKTFPLGSPCVMK